jgi:hypothetical protein
VLARKQDNRFYGKDIAVRFLPDGRRTGDLHQIGQDLSAPDQLDNLDPFLSTFFFLDDCPCGKTGMDPGGG